MEHTEILKTVKNALEAAEITAEQVQEEIAGLESNVIGAAPEDVLSTLKDVTRDLHVLRRDIGISREIVTDMTNALQIVLDLELEEGEA